MFGSQVEKSMGITLLTSLFMRFIAELKQFHQYVLKQMGLSPFLFKDDLRYQGFKTLISFRFIAATYYSTH